MPLNWFSYSGFLRPGIRLSDSPPRNLSSDVRSGLYSHFQVMTFLVTKPKPNFFFVHFFVDYSVFVPFTLWIVQTPLLNVHSLVFIISTGSPISLSRVSTSTPLLSFPPSQVLRHHLVVPDSCHPIFTAPAS